MSSRSTPYTIAIVLAAAASGAEVVVTGVLRDWGDKGVISLPQPLSTIVLLVVVLLVVSLPLITRMSDTLRESLGREAPAGSRLREEDRQRLRERLRIHYARSWKYGLRDHVQIPLTLHTRADAVRPYAMMALPEGADLFTPPEFTGPAIALGRVPCRKVYDTADKHLLILGEPGVGKSLVLLSLARELLSPPSPHESKQPPLPDDALPVIFYLAAWTAKYRDFSDWLVNELVVTYGEPRAAAQAWVDERKIVPLLDGLDEVSRDLRAACVESINRYAGQHQPGALVVCSRTKNYDELYPHQLRLRAAVEVTPLDEQQVYAALDMAVSTDVTQPLRDAWSAPEMGSLKQLLTRPRWLATLVALAPGRAAGTPLELKEVKRLLCEAYTVCELMRPEPGHSEGRPYSARPEQTTRWLGWMAAQSWKSTQEAFHPDQIQFEWLTHPRFLEDFGLPRAWLWLVAFLGALCALLALFGLAAPAWTPIFGLVYGLTLGLGVGWSLNMEARLATVMQWSWWRAGAGLVCGLLISALPALFLWIFFGLLALLIHSQFAERSGSREQREKLNTWLPQWVLAALTVTLGAALIALLVAAVVDPLVIFELVEWDLRNTPLPLDIMFRLLAGVSLVVLAGFVPALGRGPRVTKRRAAQRRLLTFRLAQSEWTACHLKECPLAKLDAVKCHQVEHLLIEQKTVQKRAAGEAPTRCYLVAWDKEGKPTGRSGKPLASQEPSLRRRKALRRTFVLGWRTVLQWRRALATASIEGEEPVPREVQKTQWTNSEEQYRGIWQSIFDTEVAALCVVLLVLLGAALNNHDLITALFDAKGNVRPDHLAAILSRENPVVPFLMGLGVGFTLPLCGGLTAIRQAFRRSRLVVADFTPWRYRRFLEYAADHHLLMRVGIGYDFIDAHLRDHAAHYWRPNELPPPPEQPQSQATARPAPQQQQVMVSRSRSAPSPSRPV